MADNIRPYRGIMPTIGQRVYIDPAATVIGMVTLGDDASVWPGTVIRGDVNTITIGSRTNIQDNATLHCTHESSFNPDGFALTIGNEVVVGHGAILHGCTIHDYALIGNGAIINDGAVIESEVIVGAGSVVAPGKTLQSGFLYIGAPAKQARPLSEAEKQFFRYSPGKYVELKDEYLAER